MLTLWAEPPGGLQHPDVYFTYGYGRAELGADDEWVLISSPDGSWQIPLVLRQFAPGVVDASSPYGYSGIYAHGGLSLEQRSAHWAETKDLLCDRGVVSLFLRDSPLVSTYTPPDDEVVAVIRHHETVALDLGPEEEMWAAMQGRARTAVRKARSSGLRVEVAPATAVDLAAEAVFRGLYEGTMARVGASAQYFFGDEYYARLLEGLAGGLLLCRVVDDAGAPVAACLVMRHGQLAHYHLSGSSPEGARMGANALMIWDVMTHLARGGARQLMLGGGAGPGSSLLRFKQSFGKAIVDFNASGVVIDEVRYRQAVQDRCDETSSTPEQLLATGYFPAYRAAL